MTTSIEALLQFLQPWRVNTSKAKAAAKLAGTAAGEQTNDEPVIIRDQTELARLNSVAVAAQNGIKPPIVDETAKAARDKLVELAAEPKIKVTEENNGGMGKRRATMLAALPGKLLPQDITPRGTVTTTKAGLRIKDIKQRPDVAHLERNKRLPDPREVLAYHDKSHHVVMAHLVQNSGFVYTSDMRDSVIRATLKPLIRPKTGMYDRTHLIPFGYHGSENDSRLVIGWSPRANQGKLNEYEREIKRLNKTRAVLWVCSVELSPTRKSATWLYKMVDPNSLKLLRPPMRSKMNGPFVWR